MRRKSRKWEKIRVGIEIALNIIFVFSIIIGAFFSLYLPLKWICWRNSSQFTKFLIQEGLPEDTAREIADAQFRSLNFFSLGRWLSAFERRKRT